MALLEMHVGGVFGVEAGCDDGLGVVLEEDVDVAGDDGLAALVGVGRARLFGLGEDIFASVELGREAVGLQPPTRLAG